MRLMTPADPERIPEIGVCVDDEVQPAAVVPVPVVQPYGSVTGKNGAQLEMRIYDKEKQRWISGTQVNPPPTPPPPIYLVSL